MFTYRAYARTAESLGDSITGFSVTFCRCVWTHKSAFMSLTIVVNVQLTIDLSVLISGLW